MAIVLLELSHFLHANASEEQINRQSISGQVFGLATKTPVTCIGVPASDSQRRLPTLALLMQILETLVMAESLAPVTCARAELPSFGCIGHLETETANGILFGSTF